jgi:hypothetical protein
VKIPPKDRIEELNDITGRCQLILDNLEHNAGWELVIEDIEKERKRLDDNWQFVTEEKQWIEWRATKMAVLKILNLMDDYKNDFKMASEERYVLENPDKVINKDVDNS